MELKKYYLFLESVGLIEYDEISPGVLYNDILKKSYPLTIAYSDSADKATLKYYLEQLGYVKAKDEEISKQQEKNKKRLDNLNNKFGYLIDIYPEEFL